MTTKILNTLAHPLTVEQENEIETKFGDIEITLLKDATELTEQEIKDIRQTPCLTGGQTPCLTCDDCLPKRFARAIDCYDVVLLPAGTPALMWRTAQEMIDQDNNTTVGFAYSQRVSTEHKQNGKTVKTSTFEHVCWQWI